ncbi:efflux RND transporter periplasmic adaptor subunit [Verrucomicrobiota bacterium sgz303538]
MAQEQSIEAARTRIQRLVEEIAALSKKELRSEDFFHQFLVRVVQATDARGGAVWLVAQRPADGKNEFQLAAEHELDSSLFRGDEAQHGMLLRALLETVKTQQAFIIPPEQQGPAPGSLEAQVAQLQGQPVTPPGSNNKTPYPFFHIPLFLKEQVLGVLQIWLQPYVTQQNYSEFISFLTSLASHVEQHLQSRRLGSVVLENQRLHHILKFSSDIAGSLDPLEVSRLAANYGRDLLGCERCSVLTLQGDRWQVLAISGQEVVEKKSSMVKAMTAFVGAHARPDQFFKIVPGMKVEGQPRPELVVLSKKELLARAEASSNGNGTADGSSSDHGNGALSPEIRRTDEIDLAYFDHSHVVSAAIAPMFDHEQQLTGAYFAESTAEGFFENAPGAKDASASQRLTEWLATHTGRSLQAARDYNSLPFLAVTKRLRDTRSALTGRKRGRFLFRISVAAAVLLGAALYPKMDQVEGSCAVTPVHRSIIVPEVPGRVDKIFVREGERVTKGQPIAQLDKTRLETELEAAHQDRARTEAEADRYRGAGDEAGAQVALLQARVAEQQEKKLEQDIAATTLRSPIDGVVMTKDIELHSGEFLQPGSLFAEVAALDAWELQVEVSEKRIGRVEKALEETKPLDVNYILYSQSAYKLNGKLEGPQQISAMAYPREKDQVFIVTLRDIAVPANLKDQLRPGLTGRAKIALGREPMSWWTTKRISDWLRLKLLH